MDSSSLLADRGNAEEYAPNLYDYQGIATGVRRFEDVTAEHIAQFHERGYLVVHEAFSREEIDQCIAAFLELLEVPEPEFELMYEKRADGVDIGSLPAEERQDHVRKFMGFVDHHPTLRSFASHPEMRAVVQQLMNGEEPVRFQDMALLKPPGGGREKPWHQDLAYFNVPPETCVVGAWIALDEATTENGCMILSAGTHRDGPVVHFKRRDWQICDDQVNHGDVLAVPLKPGGCLLFHGLIQHGTPTNRSQLRRRAAQFHYQPARTVSTSQEERLAVWGAEGKDVTC